MAERAACVSPVVAVAEDRAGEPLAPSPSSPTISVRVCSVDIGQRLDAVDEILRHRRLEALAAHHEMQMLHLRREEHDGLAGRVAAADQRHLLALAELRLDGRGPIGDAGAFELGEVWNGRPAVARAGRDHHGPRPHGIAVGELELERVAGLPSRAAAIELRHFERDGDLGAEFQRLVEGAAVSAMPEMPVGKPR